MREEMKLFKLMYMNLAAVAICLFVLSPCKLLAHDKDILSASDHTLIPRPLGGYIVAYERFSFSSYQVPLYTQTKGTKTSNETLIKTRDVTGKLTRIFYRYDHAKNKEVLIKAFNLILKGKGFSIAENNAAKIASPATAGKHFKNHLSNNPWHSELVAKVFDTQALSDTGRAIQHSNRVGDVLVASKLVGAKRVYAVLALRESDDSSHSFVGVLLDVIETDSNTPVLTMSAVSISKAMDKTGKANIEGIGFQVNQSFMTEESKFALEEIAQFLKQQSPVKYDVVITGLTKKSAAERAKQVQQALVLGWGIAREQIRAKGLAEAGRAGSITLFERQTD